MRGSAHKFNISLCFQDEVLHHNQSEGLIVSNRTLVIQSLTREDGGNYQCEATNPEGTVKSDNYTLEIQCKFLSSELKDIFCPFQFIPRYSF